MKEDNLDRQTFIPLPIYLNLRPWFATLVILVYAISVSPDVRTFLFWLPVVSVSAVVMGFSWACLAERAGRLNGGNACRICTLVSTMIVFLAFAIVVIAIRTKL